MLCHMHNSLWFLYLTAERKDGKREHVHIACHPTGTVPPENEGFPMWQFIGSPQGLLMTPALTMPKFGFDSGDNWVVDYVVLHPDVEDADIDFLHKMINESAPEELVKIMDFLIHEEVLIDKTKRRA